MEFQLNPVIRDSGSLQEFFARWSVGSRDLIITNEYLVKPYLAGKKAPCPVLYQEKYGRGEPSDEMVDAMFAAVAGQEIDRIIAIGGGTVIDISKLFVFGGNLTCQEVYAQGTALARKRKLIIIPTTCGTGSEVTGISVVEHKKKGTKLGLAVPALYADEAVLIPALLGSLPYEVFATSSIDALIHAVESYISPSATPFSRSLGRAAIEDILGGYQAMNGERKLPSDMTQFLFASTMAGIAFSNAGCAAVHALSYPVSASWHVPHGKANYMLFEAVIGTYKKLNAPLEPLEQILAGALSCTAELVWTKFFALIRSVYDSQPLSQLGCDEEKCRQMAASVIQTQQRLLANNPVPLDEAQMAEIYKSCL